MKPVPAAAGVFEIHRSDERDAYGDIATTDRPQFEAIARAAGLVAGVPVAVVAVLDGSRQWLRTSQGPLSHEVGPEASFTDYVVRERAVLVVEDALADPRFATHPLVATDNGVRFYAGFPLIVPSGEVLGALCVTDVTPRTLSADKIQILTVLADQVMAQLELARQMASTMSQHDAIERRRVMLDAVLDSIDVGVLVTDADGALLRDNKFGREALGISVQEILATPAAERANALPLATLFGHPLAASDRPMARVMRDGVLPPTDLVLRPGTPGAQTVRVRGRTVRAPDGTHVGAMIAADDITAIRERESELSARVRDVERLADASRQILGGQEPMSVACDTVRKFCAAQQVSVLVPDGAGQLRTAASTEPALGEMTIPVDGPSRIAVAFRSRNIQLVDAVSDVRVPGAAPWSIIEEQHGPVGAAVYTPLVHDDECSGVMIITLAANEGPLPARVLRPLQIVTDELSTTLQRDRLRRQLSDAASTDPLTGLANRRTWDERMAALPTDDAAGQPAVLAVLDLDHFKLFNDTYGHQAGDRLLSQLATAWTGALPDDVLLARLGGEEFGLLITGVALADAVAVVDRFRELVPLGQTVSAGVSERYAGESAQTWFARTDRALYRAKADGRDCVCVDTEPFRERRRRRTDGS